MLRYLCLGFSIPYHYLTFAGNHTDPGFIFRESRVLDGELRIEGWEKSRDGPGRNFPNGNVVAKQPCRDQPLVGIGNFGEKSSRDRTGEFEECLS